MLKVLYIFVISIIAFVQTQQEIYYRWDYKYNSSLNGWYKFHEMPADWPEARRRCALEKAIIMSPVNDTFKAVMREQVAQRPNRLPNIFTGFNTMLTTGYFISYEGVPLDTTQQEWAENEPKRVKDVAKGTCLTIDSSGKLGVENCTEVLPFVCYKKYQKLNKNSCGYISGYEYDPPTDRCYRVYATPKNRSEAHRVCAADGGELAAVDGERAASAVKRFFENRDVHEFAGDLLQVGVHSLFEKNEWLTVHGETLKEAGYDNLKIFNENHRCASMWRNGEIWTVQCDGVLPFVCQKKKDLGYRIQ